ncbi:MAG: UvrD-helicase domain-containing protein [Kiritimatiellae bacterium]|nr:UvrD-helicase domain-containing protein [Kiritimatiellia bacterium]
MLHQDGKGTFTFLHVDTHDSAYAWAKRNRFEVNPYTGEVQLYVVDIPEVKVAATESKDGERTYGPFWKLPTDEDLKRMGVPAEQIALVRSLKDDEDILSHEGDFSQGVFDALLLSYDGKTPEEVIKELDLAKKSVNVDDVAKAVEESDASQSQFAFASTEEELNEIRKAALAKWRVFLHPSQRKIVRKDVNGPMKVLGGAGTGKTVVAMHRAKFLLEHIFVKPSDRILFTTFTKNLCDDIEMLLSSICSDEQMRRIDVRNLDKWAIDYVHSLGIEANPITDEKRRFDLMEKAMLEVDGADSWKPGFFLRERAQVVLPNGVESLSAYLKVSRAGQGVRLSAQQKRIVWQVLEAYRTILAQEKLMDFDEIAILAANQVRASGSSPYAAVIVDEAQDFSAPALRLVAAISGNTKEEPKANSLMIVGDAHQRIYGKKAILGKCGINVVGRSSKLKLNYRTTEKIRKRAVALLLGVAADDLDGAADDNKGFRSLVVGIEPLEKRFKTFDKEMDGIVDTILAWKKADGRTFSDYAVLVRRKSDVAAIRAALNERGMKSKEIKTDLTIRESEKDLVRVATMHRSKGLEFAGVIVAEVNSGIWPLRPDEYDDMDTIARKASDDSERSLLYVALTRAMNHAMITGTGMAPAEL